MSIPLLFLAKLCSAVRSDSLTQAFIWRRLTLVTSLFNPFFFMSYGLVKKVLARIGLGIIHTLVVLKATSRVVARGLARPFSGVWRFALPRVIVPGYHAMYTVRRKITHWYRPAKNRLMYAVANRHMFHTVAIGIAVTAGIVNFQLDDVRAETYGERSLMYGLVTNNTEQLIDQYANIDVVGQTTPVKYLSAGVLTAPLATGGAVENLTTSTVIGGALSSLAIAEDSASVAPRDAIEEYAVQDGDTLSTIAAQYGISLNTLLWANSLSVRSIVKPGQMLKILPVSGVVHTVKNGDTVARIAKTYSVSEDQILAYNNIDNATGLQVSQALVIPGGELKAPAPTTRRAAVSSIFSAAPATSAARASTGAKMIWPTDLTYIVRGLSWYHTGVDIDCNGHRDGSSTNDNYAAADGIVQYAAPKSGYGITVEINHGNGIVTRYGHHNTLYVTVGQQVTAATPIGRCGSTGNSTGTHLHFEVIANGAFVNPLSYIR